MRTGKIQSRSYADPIERVISPVIGESLTRQDQADLVNINKIYARTQRGEIVLASERMPDYGDYSNVNSYDQMLEMINDAEEAFLSLSSEERKKYNHNPAEYYEKKLQEGTDKLQAQADEKAKADKQALYDKKVADAKTLLNIKDEKSS